MNARKKDRRRKKAEKNQTSEKIATIQDCKNCGHSNLGSYCSNCGQNFESANKPMKDIFSDFFGMFSLDSSIFKTIIPFLFKPGFLSREFLDGRRKKYLSPIKLYLFLSILFFFIAGKSTQNAISESGDNFLVTESSDTISENDSIHKSDSTSIVALDNASLFSISMNDSTLVDLSDTQGDEADGKIEEGALKASENKALFLANLMKNISYSIFLLMPLFALLLKLAYIRRKRFYVEHLIFSINIHSFALLIFSLMVFSEQIFTTNSSFTLILLLVIPVYFIIGMMRFYNQKFFKVLLKSIFVGSIYTALMLGVLTGITVLTVALF